jgi:hypothetical protein
MVLGMPSKRFIVNGVLPVSTKVKGSPSFAKLQVTGCISSRTRSSYNGKWLRRTLDEIKSVLKVLSYTALPLVMQYVICIIPVPIGCVDVFLFVHEVVGHNIPDRHDQISDADRWVHT